MDSRERAIAVAAHYQRNSLDGDSDFVLRGGESEAELRDSFVEKFVRSGSFGDLTEENIREIKDRMRLDFAEARSVAITEYEDIGLAVLISRLIKDIKDSIGDKENVLDKILFSSLSSGRVNGVAIGIIDSDYKLIFLESGLFGFANLMSKIVAQCLVPTSSDRDDFVTFSLDPVEVSIKCSQEEVLIRLVDLIVAYLVLGNPHRAEPYLIPYSLQAPSSMLRRDLELFVLAHEVGHVVLGHLDGGGAHNSTAGGELDSTEAFEIPQTWEREFEADLYGMRTLLAVNGKQGFDLALSYWGIEFFFYSIEFLHRCAAVLNDEVYHHDGSQTHPPCSQRRQFLRLALESWFAKDNSDALQGAYKLSDQIGVIFDRLFENAEPVLRQMSSRGAVTKIQWRKAR